MKNWNHHLVFHLFHHEYLIASFSPCPSHGLLCPGSHRATGLYFNLSVVDHGQHLGRCGAKKSPQRNQNESSRTSGCIEDPLLTSKFLEQQKTAKVWGHTLDGVPNSLRRIQVFQVTLGLLPKMQELPKIQKLVEMHRDMRRFGSSQLNSLRMDP